jgi:hypothetical protein
MMQTFVPILSYFMLNNKTIETNIHESNVLYTFDLASVHIDEVTGYTIKEFKPIEGTNKIFIHLGGINASVDINGELKALHLIPFRAERVEVSGVDIQLTVESTSTDRVHWAISESTKLTYESLKIKMHTSAMQKLVDASNKIINLVIKNIIIPKVQNGIDGLVVKFNEMLANQGPTTFVFPILNLDKNEIYLNMTMPTAPSLDGQIITLTFDGMFVDKDVHTTTDDITKLPSRILHDRSN